MLKYIALITAAIAGIVIAVVFANGYNYKFKTRNTIPVVGSAEYNFIADLIVWSASYTRTSMDLKEAYSQLKQDEQQVRQYLVKTGVQANEAVFSSISIQRQFESRYDEKGNQVGTTFTGYRLDQTIRVESKGIAKVEKVSREITELLQSGIELNSQEPQYFYTKLSDLKINLLSKAAMDAHTRAKTIADNAKSSLGKLRKASMGVFQITGQYSNEDFTYGGAFNTTNKAKTATVTVRLEYELE